MSINILICGIGGQGTVLAAKLLDQAALLGGLTVHSAETIGMAQRGGSVVSHVRIGEDCWSPLIPFGQADMIIAFEMTEAARNIRYLKKNGTMIVNSHIATGAENSGGLDILEFLEKNCASLHIVDSKKICAELGTPKVANTVLLGAALSHGIEGINMQSAIEAVRTTVKPALAEINIKALEKGFGGKS
ncbi:indolepyruvate oxidoreductase subunit beta [Treponema sp.]|uniref:indolepyruvate oxidoreductase subunit beta n=1 Tax=Treponema sp. TaxID=166 RepID=UPI003F0AFFB4